MVGVKTFPTGVAWHAAARLPIVRLKDLLGLLTALNYPQREELHLRLPPLVIQ